MRRIVEIKIPDVEVGLTLMTRFRNWCILKLAGGRAVCINAKIDGGLIVGEGALIDSVTLIGGRSTKFGIMVLDKEELNAY